MWTLVVTGVALSAALGVLAWVRFHRVKVTRLSPAQEEAEAAEHCRPLANVTVLHRDDDQGREGG
jgi:hypothetical protein